MHDHLTKRAEKCNNVKELQANLKLIASTATTNDEISFELTKYEISLAKLQEQLKAKKLKS